MWKRGLTLWTSGDHDDNMVESEVRRENEEDRRPKTSQIADTCKSEGLFDGLKKEHYSPLVPAGILWRTFSAGSKEIRKIHARIVVLAGNCRLGDFLGPR